MSCPICLKPRDEKYRPFCSKRCSDIDLGRWLTEGYVIEGTPEEDLTEIPAAPPPERKH